MNSTYIGGQTRQYGNLSFTRVYESGHEVPAYQPETAYRIFSRSLFNLDIATGNISTLDNLVSTKGPATVYNITNKPIVDPGSQCYVLDSSSCTEEQWATVENGTALVRNWIVVDANTTNLFPDLTNSTGGNSTVPSSTGTAGPAPSATSGGAPAPSQGAAAARLFGDQVRVLGFEINLIGSVVLSAILGTFVAML